MLLKRADAVGYHLTVYLAHRGAACAAHATPLGVPLSSRTSGEPCAQAFWWFGWACCVPVVSLVLRPSGGLGGPVEPVARLCGLCHAREPLWSVSGARMGGAPHDAAVWTVPVKWGLSCQCKGNGASLVCQRSLAPLKGASCVSARGKEPLHEPLVSVQGARVPCGLSHKWASWHMMLTLLSRTRTAVSLRIWAARPHGDMFLSRGGVVVM